MINNIKKSKLPKRDKRTEKDKTCDSMENRVDLKKMTNIDLELAIELLKSKGCRILPEKGNFNFFVNNDKNGYNFIIVPENPIYSIVILGFDEKKATGLRDQLDQLLKKD